MNGGIKVFNPRYQCDGKRPYVKKADAKRAAKLSERSLGRLRAYRCPHCGFFHLGHSVHPRSVGDVD